MDGMRIYVVTSQKHDCNNTLAYADGMLSGMSMGGCMPKAARAAFLKTIPLAVESPEALGEIFSTCKVQELVLVPDFEEFWNAYNYKHDRDLAAKEWRGMGDAERVAAYVNIKRYDAFIRARGQAKLYAVRYLKRRTWENDLGK